MKIEFHGADRNVTGSCHLIRCHGKLVLVDCGMYQGGREIDEENSGDFGFDPRAVDFLVLTHAHLDHCGRIPLLVKRGFRGTIVATPATRELARLVMLDSARIQEEEALYKSRKQRRRGERDGEAQPLYTTLDALNCLDFFTEVPGFEDPRTLAEGIRMTFFDSGHILGAAAVLFELEENGYRRRVLFSGDLGYSGRIILRDPARPPHADVVVMETTYGDRRHKELAPSIEELYRAVTETLDRGGNVLIPSFALERSQEIIYYLREGLAQGKVPRNMRVFLDSPMAISATEIFRRHPECYDAETSKLFRSGQDPFDLPGLHFTRETADSMSLNKLRGGAVIIAGSGMCTGGRIRHHLKHNLWRREASIVFVGYAARGTLARRIIDGARKVTLFGEEIVVRAGIHTIGGFSAHADQDELLAWYRRTGEPETTFLVHGEEESMTVLAKFLDHTRVEMPRLHQEYDL
ncbi:ribonuclease [bacterium BMS3Bbin14]|nr:ribonuclease [bacterium BMS3Abin13]GBE51640.1 ribonuclease [bacterium BMS3Bbin14]HDK44057.1 MBL fold metallo-hydrolase [Desulfobacteraceae bacterium]HDL98484.1 MBL fold metallo-hydrolase [Desulfobacteraceae bacterium]HDO31347.1 MBL fold metallo-hydrolase [Desulfobacteraceae bacterium]